MEFIKSGELQLINGGYLATKEETLVTHPEFVAAQESAHYLVTLASAFEKKDFVGKKADSVEDTIQEVVDQLNNASAVKYDTEVKEPKRKITDSLAKEALAWIEYQKDSANSEELNNDMQAFNIINDFEQVGLYFSKGMSKLTRIYTIAEILTAAKLVSKTVNA